MLRTAGLIGLLVIGLAACKKKEPDAPEKAGTTVPAGVAVDGVRRVAIEANKEGYHPDRISAPASSKLVLVFTRTADSECISQVKTPDGKLVDLPMNKPVDVAVTVPPTGEVAFACGMDMFHGSIVADPR